jgi:hypothetical protein
LKNSPSQSGVFRPRIFAAFLLFSAGLCLAGFSFNNQPSPERTGDSATPERYMPVPGGEADDLDRLEALWNDRLTYPTGRFDPSWLRVAAADDARITRGAGRRGGRSSVAQRHNPRSDQFHRAGSATAPDDGCSGCFDYGLTEGRVNDIVVIRQRRPTARLSLTPLRSAAGFGKQPTAAPARLPGRSRRTIRSSPP